MVEDFSTQFDSLYLLMMGERNMLKSLCTCTYILFFSLILTKLLVARFCYTVSREEETKESFFEFIEIYTKIITVSNKRYFQNIFSPWIIIKSKSMTCFSFSLKLYLQSRKWRLISKEVLSHLSRYSATMSMVFASVDHKVVLSFF